MNDNLICMKVNEVGRTYDFDGRAYYIKDPVEVWARKGGSTHRVVDKAGVVHVVPGPGYRGCVIRYVPINSKDPVQA